MPYSVWKAIQIPILNHSTKRSELSLLLTRIIYDYHPYTQRKVEKPSLEGKTLRISPIQTGLSYILRACEELNYEGKKKDGFCI
jgi:hypothetical protein